MEIKDILLLLAPDTPNQARLMLAGRLGREHGALVTGLCCAAAPAPSLADAYAIGSAAIADVIDHEALALRDMVAPVETAFHLAMQFTRAPSAWADPVVNEPADETARRARAVDLAIIGRADDRGGPAAGLAERLVLDSGTACLVVPETGRHPDSFDRVIVAWNGSREAKRALDDGLVFLKRAATVEVVAHGAGDPATAGETDALLAHLARHGVTARLCRIQSKERADEALRRRCADFGADLLVMGAYSHSRTAEMILGGVTRAMLAHPPIPVLMSR